jgi:hypothetical protein
LHQPHGYLYASLRKRDVGFEVNREFNVDGLFIGASLSLHVSGLIVTYIHRSWFHSSES